MPQVNWDNEQAGACTGVITEEKAAKAYAGVSSGFAWIT